MENLRWGYKRKSYKCARFNMDAKFKIFLVVVMVIVTTLQWHCWSARRQSLCHPYVDDEAKEGDEDNSGDGSGHSTT